MTKVKKIGEVNGQDLLVFEEEVPMVAVKPICTALGIRHAVQYKNIKSHCILSDEWRLCHKIGQDGKRHKMICLPEHALIGWLLGINPRNVKEDAKEAVKERLKECYEKLVKYFKNEYLTQTKTNSVAHR